MKISLKWLKTLVDYKSTTQELADALTMAGLEVDSIEQPFEHLSGVTTGRIKKVTPHPNADKLRVCMVDTGEEEPLQIVCGAPNVYEGMVSAVALPGTVLPGGLKLKKSKIRGEHSFGMMCSSRELELTDESEGIMDLSKEITPGTPLIEALELDDTIVEIGLTPNRADCLSLIGVAREVAIIEGMDVNFPVAEKYKDSANSGEVMDKIAVEVKDKDLCPKYCARYIDNVKIGPSPWWLQRILLCLGMRPVNNVVDVTNYVMLETGQPLHAFDFNEINGAKIVVKRAQEGSKFTALDSKERVLDSEMLMICDSEKEIGIAGVMGGENSEVTEKTEKVVLESAYFFPPSVRKTAKRLSLATDASHRFERGVDHAGVEFALNRAAELIEEVSKGTTCSGYISTQEEPFKEISVTLNVDACNRRIGIDVSSGKMESYLKSAGFEIIKNDEADIEVKVPSFRVDVERPEDLSEEIARIYGYNNIQTTFPKLGSKRGVDVPQFKARLDVKENLKALGFNEIINYSFISPEDLKKSGYKEDNLPESVAILNPLSEDQSIMRTTLIPGVLNIIKTNIAQQVTDLRLFEVGQIFIPDSTKDNLQRQEELICAAWTGARTEASWDTKPPQADFFDIKGAAEVFFKDFQISPVFKAPEKELPPYVRPGAAASIFSGDTEIGIIFEIHHKVLKEFDINQPVFMFQTELEKIIEFEKLPYFTREIPKFPAATRDITIITPVETPTGDIVEFYKSQKEELLESVDLFDVYQGEPVPENEKSLSFRLTYRAKDKTLKDKQINKAHDRLTSKLLKNFNIRFPG